MGIRTAQPRVARAYVACLREAALAYPEAWADNPWGQWAAKVRKKLFVALYLDQKEHVRLMVKLPHSGEMALSLPFAAPTGYGLGKSGWVSFAYAPSEGPPVDVALEWIRESYCAIAPKALVEQLAG